MKFYHGVNFELCTIKYCARLLMLCNDNFFLGSCDNCIFDTNMLVNVDVTNVDIRTGDERYDRLYSCLFPFLSSLV